MISERTVVRLRAALDQWFVVVAVVLLALALVGGWAAYGSLAATDTDAETDQQAVETWSTTGDFEHSATVQTENEAFPVGTELEDRSVYFTEIAPELESTFAFGYDASDGDVDVDLEAERVIRSVDDEDGTEHWAVNETLAETSEQSLAPGEELATSVSLDVPATMNETEAVEESLGGSAGTTETVVVVEVAVEGTIDGDAVDRTETYELEVDPGSSTYSVETSSADGQVTEQTESGDQDNEVAAADSSGFLSSVGSALLAFVSVCALGALAITKANGTLAPSDRELERVRAKYEREEFDDWISRGSLPEDVRERSRIKVSTLEDLVDVAIDSDRRVLEDERAGEYYVVDGDSLYVYEPGSLEDAREPSGDETTGSDDHGPGRTDEEAVLADDSSADESDRGDGNKDYDS